MSEQIPTVNRIVNYKLNASDVSTIAHRRANVATARGNAVAEGDVFPMMIVRTWGNTPGSAVNGQVFLDGTDQLWVTSRTVGDQPGQFAWPVRS